jgi:hypothetical protein
VSIAHGVGYVASNDPDPLAAMGRPGVERAQHAPARIVPQRGQISEYDIKPPPSKHWAVFHEHVTGSYLAKDASELPPEARSGSSETAPRPRGTNVLAGKAARNDVNNAPPRASVEGTNIIPNRERWQVPIILSLAKSSDAKGVQLHGADGPPAKEGSPEDASTSAGKEGKFT